MALLLCSNSLSLTSKSSVSETSSFPTSSFSLTLTVPAALMSKRLHLKPINLLAKSSDGVCFGPTPIAAKKKGTLIVKASSDIIDGGGDTQSESDDEEENFLVGGIPLDAKLQEKLEKKLKMKVAKKIRLRRKKLVHKRGLRKKGRWPPSKMKKLSNV